jgi:hypothetical protein
MQQGMYLDELQLRNNQTIRDMFAEIICVLANSPKKNGFEPIKINRVEEFDMTQMTERLKADSLHYADEILKKDDPKELLIAINEFSYHLSCSKNTINACYWIEWIIDFDNICKKRKKPCQCQRRNNISVENRFQKDIIWIFWDVIKYYIEKTNNIFLTKLFDSLLDIFCIKYTTAACKRRRYLLYFAVALLTEQVPNNIELMPNKPMISSIVDKINEVYKQVKKKRKKSKYRIFIFWY